MRILVTGGAGFIGSHVAEAAVAAGHDVHVLDDLSSGKRENVPDGAALTVADIRDADAVERVFAEFKPDAVSHQAAQVSVSVSTREPVMDARVNIVGSLHVLEAAARQRVGRVVFASTGGAIYGEVPEPERAGEDRAPLPLSPYACSKLAVESYLRYFQHEHGLGYTVLRYANVYGPRQDPHGEAGVVAIFCQRLLRGVPIQVNARATVGDDGCVRDYTYVGDVVKANMRAFEGIDHQVTNVGTGVGTTTRRLAELLRELTGSRGEVRDGARRAGDVERSVLDPTRCHAVIGQTTDLKDGLGRTVEWFRSQA